jgi:Fibronectin type III domain
MKREPSALSLARIAASLATVPLWLALSESAHAASHATLAWNPNPKSDNVTSYRVHYRSASGTNTGFIEVGNQTTADVSRLPYDSYFASVTAVNSFGIESEPSEEVTFSLTPGTRIISALVEPVTSNGQKGIVTLTVTPTGVVTGRLTLGAAAYTVRSMFDSNGRLSLIIRRRLPARNLTLALFLQPDRNLTGTISDGVNSSSISGEATTFVSRTYEARQKGRYTVAMRPDDSPFATSQGLGVATLTVSNLGVARLAGSISDGAKLSYSGSVSDAGGLPIFIPLYNKLGSLFGKATFRDVPGVSDADGAIRWYKPAKTQPVATLGFIAARYSYTRGLPVIPGLGLSASHARISLRRGGLAADIADRSLYISPMNLVSILPPNAERAALSLAPSTGTFTGQFLASPGSLRSIRGVLVKKGAGFGFGWFSSPSQSGIVEILPIR